MLSLRDVEDLLVERGIIVSYESIRQWSFARERSPTGEGWSTPAENDADCYLEKFCRMFIKLTKPSRPRR